MRKSLGKRLISGVTAALTAVMIFPNVTPTSMAGETADINSAKTVFSLERDGALTYKYTTNWMGMPMEQTTYKYADQLYAQINFEDEAGSPAAVDLGDNQYYLLVHAVGRSSGGTGYQYKDGENRDYYKLIEIGDGPSWTTEKFGEDLRPYYGEGFFRQQPATEKVEGILLKNKESGELSLEDATALKNCEVVDSIDGYTVVPSADLTVRTTPTEDAAFGNDTVSVKAVKNAYAVDINVYDADGIRTFIDKPGYNYYMLTYIGEHDDAIRHRSDLKGWAIEKVTPDAANHGSYYQQAVTFSEFIPFGEDGSSTDGEKIKYDKNKYRVGYRLYRTLDAETELKTYADCIDPAKAADSIPSYIFDSKDGDNSATVDIYRDQLTALNIEFESDEALNIRAEESYYVLVTVEHQSGDPSYFLGQIVSDGTNKITVVAQPLEGDSMWVDKNNEKLIHERYKGTEKSISFEILHAKLNDGEEFKANQAIDFGSGRTKCVTVEDGTPISAYILNEGGFTKTANEDKTEATFTKKYTLTKNPVDTDKDFQSILGDALFFGITADRYNQAGHAQTNFAANYYQNTASVQQPNLSGGFAGHIYIANYADFSDGKTTVDESNIVPPADFATNALGTFSLGDWGKEDRDAPIVHVQDAKSVGPKDLIKTEENPTGAEVRTETADEMMTKVNSVIDTMKATSAELLTHPATIKPIVVDGFGFIDTMSFPDNADIYIDADEILPCLSDAGKLNIKMKQGQTIIFNFDDPSYNRD